MCLACRLFEAIIVDNLEWVMVHLAVCALGDVELLRCFGASRTTIRKPIHSLESNTVVKRQTKVGARSVRLMKQYVLQLCEVRESLEGTAVRLTTGNTTDKAIGPLRLSPPARARRL